MPPWLPEKRGYQFLRVQVLVELFEFEKLGVLKSLVFLEFTLFRKTKDQVTFVVS